jgi:hypothetical protein
MLPINNWTCACSKLPHDLFRRASITATFPSNDKAHVRLHFLYLSGNRTHCGVRGDSLLGFDHRHVGVVCAMQDKKRHLNLGDVWRMAAKAVQPSLESPATTVAPPTDAETLKPVQSGSAPLLAALSFTNRSSLPEDDLFAEGMVEDVTSAL